MIGSIQESTYLPSIEFFEIIKKCNVFVINDMVKYDKNKLHSISNLDKDQKLVVPIITGNNNKIKNVSIPTKLIPWQKNHLNIIRKVYRNSKYFEEYYNIFDRIYNKRIWHNLSTLNTYIIKSIVDLLELDVDIYVASDITRNKSKVEICRELGITKYINNEIMNISNFNMFSRFDIEVVS